MPELSPDIILREADITIKLPSQTIDLGRVFNVMLIPQPIKTKNNWLGNSKVKGYLVKVAWESNQNSNDWLRELQSMLDVRVDIFITESSTNKLFPFTNVYLTISPDLDFNLGEKLISYASEKVFSFSDWISLIPPAGDFTLYIEKYNHDFAMQSQELTLSLSSATKISDVASPTGYSALFVTAIDHGYATGNIVTISSVTESEYNQRLDIVVLSNKSFKMVLSASAASTGTISTAKSTRESFSLYARIDSRLTIEDADEFDNHVVKMYIRNYLTVSAWLSGDYLFTDHLIYKNYSQRISVPYDSADQTTALKIFEIEDFTIESTLDLYDGSTYQLFATSSLTTAEVASLVAYLEG